MADHKLEFFKIRLRPSKKKYDGTFRDFSVDVLGADPDLSDSDISSILYEYFIDCLKGEHTHDKSKKKKIEFFDDTENNLYFTLKPKSYPSDFTIRGVLDGGPYGAQRLIRDIDNPETASRVRDTNVVASYFYVYVYLPPGGNVGCFGVHSHGMQENNSATFRRFIKKIFLGPGYYAAETTIFCPKQIQEEFLDGGTVAELRFTKSSVPLYHQNHGVREELGLFKITVTAIPLDSETSGNSARALSDKVGGYELGRDETDDEESFLTLNDFDRKKVQIQNDRLKQSKSFFVSDIEETVKPAININAFLELEPEIEPSFSQIDEFCDKFFKETILEEIKPEQTVRRL
ncbi:MAG TPA: hypothetical protein PKA82_05645 [Pyrinomonadaceae bacterium]|nr:hypothetical protein [Pyrinomonadaceae bacterium]